MDPPAPAPAPAPAPDPDPAPAPAPDSLVMTPQQLREAYQDLPPLQPCRPRGGHHVQPQIPPAVTPPVYTVEELREIYHALPALHPIRPRGQLRGLPNPLPSAASALHPIRHSIPPPQHSGEFLQFLPTLSLRLMVTAICFLDLPDLPPASASPILPIGHGECLQCFSSLSSMC